VPRVKKVLFNTLAAELSPKEETSAMTATLVLLVKMENLALLVNLVISAKRVKLAILDLKDFLVPLVSENDTFILDKSVKRGIGILSDD
jgi:hypothetical protein